MSSLGVSAAMLLVLMVICPSRGHNSTSEAVRGSIQINTRGNVSEFRSIRISGNDFLLDGNKFRYVAGSLHYFRVPRAHWRDRLQKLKAAGLNAVSTYVEWSFHEPEERQYRWEGDQDLVYFVKLAAELNLLVLLRPGPYICAERDLGGLPYWLLSKYPDIKLRSTDTDYMSESKLWLDVLFEKMKPLLYGNGGPIILVQVENEYGSYACEAAYMEQLRDLMQGHVGDAALLYTTDGSADNMIRCGSVNNTLTTIDFGSGEKVETAFKTLRMYMNTGPLVNSEYYPGWLTHWGEGSMQRVSSAKVITTLREMLDLGASLNFYVFFGGTNFEFTAGANFGTVYQPDVTSYDYDAPLTEYGNPTPKYDEIKKVLEEYHHWAKAIPRPADVSTATYGKVVLTPRVALMSKSGRTILGVNNSSVTGSKLPTFESRRQRAGLLLFETAVPLGPTDRLLSIKKPRDRVYVYVDGRLTGWLSRMHGILSLPLRVKRDSKLSLLVENQGRINYGNKLKDFKGILSAVQLDQVTLSGNWSVLGYPLEKLDIPNDASTESVQGTLYHGPVLFEGSFMVPEGESPRDTFLNPTGLTKGYAWVNDYNLGRYWPGTGPQTTLYVPAAFLRAAPAPNVLRVLELESANATPDLHVRLIDSPIFDRNPNINITRLSI